MLIEFQIFIHDGVHFFKRIGGVFDIRLKIDISEDDIQLSYQLVFNLLHNLVNTTIVIVKCFAVDIRGICNIFDRDVIVIFFCQKRCERIADGTFRFYDSSVGFSFCLFHMSLNIGKQIAESVGNISAI